MYKGIIYRYSIFNDMGNEVSYIGQTCSDKKRRSDFLNRNMQYSGCRIENARKKYGSENFKYEILEEIECQTILERNRLLNEREQYYIGLYNSFGKGYNNTLGGGGANGYQHTEEYKKWQSKKSTELAKNPDYRKKISDGIKAYYNCPVARTRKSIETKERYLNPVERAKTSIIQKMSYVTNPDRAKKHSDKLKVVCNTPEGKKRMSDTIINAWKTNEYRDKYSISKKALWATEEFRDKMIIAYKGMNGKMVLQSTLDGIPVNEYESAVEAARQLGYSFGGICRVCRGERAQYKGFKWSYMK